MKFFRFILFLIFISIITLSLKKLMLEPIWEYIQQTYDFHRGFVHTIDSYIPGILAIIIGYSLSRWLFVLWRWEILGQEPISPQKKVIIHEVELTDSRLETKDSAIGKKYIVQLTEDELLYVKSTLEDLEKRMEKTVTFSFSSSNVRLSIHLINGEKRPAKRVVRHSFILLFIIGSCFGIYLVCTELWSLLTAL